MLSRSLTRFVSWNVVRRTGPLRFSSRVMPGAPFSRGCRCEAMAGDRVRHRYLHRYRDRHPGDDAFMERRLPGADGQDAQPTCRRPNADISPTRPIRDKAFVDFSDDARGRSSMTPPPVDLPTEHLQPSRSTSQRPPRSGMGVLEICPSMRQVRAGAKEGDRRTAGAAGADRPGRKPMARWCRAMNWFGACWKKAASSARTR